MKNPFRFDRLPVDSDFANRVEEVQRIVKAIIDGENLLVHGDRRMGKTSCLLRAARKAAADHDATCFIVDVSRYSTLADATQALLRDAVPALSTMGGKATAWLASKVKGLVLKPSVSLSLDASHAGGSEMELEFGVELRNQDAAAHATAMVEVLDALNTLAGKRQRTVAVILDEFTFIEKIGPARVSWILRSAMQRHQHIVYILAGSAHHVIERLHGADGAFFGMFGRLHVGPIAADELVTWINTKFRAAGLKPDNVGERCTLLAGERTRDIVQLARRAFDLAAVAGKANATIVDAAFRSLVDDSDAVYQAAWADLAPRAQSILRAIAAGDGGTLFHETTRIKHALGKTAEITQVCRRLTRTAKNTNDFRDAILVRISHPANIEHRFDNPFFAEWVRRLDRRALA